MLSDLRTVKPVRATHPLILTKHGSIYVDLAGNEVHDFPIQRFRPPQEVAKLAIELQQQRESQSRRTALARHQTMFITDQRPVGYQPIKVSAEIHTQTIADYPMSRPQTLDFIW